MWVLKKFKRLLMKCGLVKLKAGIIVLGLSGAGKTTIVHHLTKESVEEVVPTVGFSIEKVKYKRVKLTVMDMSGQNRYQPLWEHYYRDAQGIMFVIDAADPAHLHESRGVLDSVISRQEVQGLPLLVMCNKLDIPGALQPADIAAQMGLYKITGRPYQLHGCIALTGTNITPGVEWLMGVVRRQL